jgi:hypothetical protein
LPSDQASRRSSPARARVPPGPFSPTLYLKSASIDLRYAAAVVRCLLVVASLAMPRFAQRLVSKQKRRITRDEHELDLSYVWPEPELPSGLPKPAPAPPPRLITMGFPASGNEIMCVAPFPQAGHQPRLSARGPGTAIQWTK